MGLGSPLGFAPGTVAMWAALVFGVLTALAYWRVMRMGFATEDFLRRGKRGDASLAAAGPALLTLEENPNPNLNSDLFLARRLYYAFTFSVVLASVLLMGRLLSHDFRLSYVSSYSGRDLPFYYLAKLDAMYYWDSAEAQEKTGIAGPVEKVWI